MLLSPSEGSLSKAQPVLTGQARLSRLRRRKPDRDERLGVSYARYSEEIQGSIPEQEGTNRGVAADFDVKIVDYFRDEAISRSIQERPGLMAMLIYLEAHPEVGFIVINELERLTAGVSQRGEITEICQRLHVTLLTEDMDDIDPFDEEKMQEADKRAVEAKGEVLKVQRRVRRTMKQKFGPETQRVSMRPAFGTRMKPLLGPDGKALQPGMKLVDENGRTIRSGELEKDPNEFPHLQAMFKMADEGKTDAEIARHLTDRIPTKSGNRMWRANTVAGILTNPLYKGEYTWGKQAVRRYSNGKTYLEERPEGDPGRVTKQLSSGPFIPVELWERVNERRKARLDTLRFKRRTRDVQLFDERMFCLECGYKLYGMMANAGRPEPKRRYKPVRFNYACNNARRGNTTKPGFKPPCEKSRIMSDYHLFDALAAALDSDAERYVTVYRAAVNADHVVARKAELEKHIRVAEAKLERAVNLHLDDPEMMPRPKLDKLKAETAEEIEKARQELAGLTVERAISVPEQDEMLLRPVVELVEQLRDLTTPVELRRQLLSRAGIERFYVHRPHVMIEFSKGYAGVE
jgi:hypothetical protein